MIVTDVDECVLGWADSFTQWLVSNGYNLKTEWNKYDCIEDWLNDNVPDWNFDIIYKFNKDNEFSLLKPTKKSDIFIPLLYQMGHNFIALSACGSDPETYKLRKKNLDTLFPDIFKDIICVDSGKDKFQYLKMLKGNIWVEDNFQNACYGTELKYETFIIDYHHNKSDHEHMTRVSDWEQIYNSII